MYTDIQPLRGSDAHTSVMYTTDNVHIWSMLLVSHVIMYTTIQPLRGSVAHTRQTSIMYTTVNIHIWSMRLCSRVIMYVHNVKATPPGKLRIHIQVSYPYMVIC